MAIRLPYGNAFIAETPSLDKLGDRLYAEERQNALMRQKEIQHLDDEFARNVSGIRDADVGDVTKAYGEWKLMNQQLMKQKDGIHPDQQMELLRKKAEMYKILNQSKQEKEREKFLATQIAKDTKGIYDDKAASRLRSKIGLPISRWREYQEAGEDGKQKPVDLTDDKSYLYQMGTTDFSKPLKAAEGIKRPLNALDPEVDPKDPLKQLIRGYEGGNNPFDYYNTLVSGIAGQKATKDFAMTVDQQYTPEQVQSIEKAFTDMVGSDKYKKIYGLGPNNQFPSSAYNTKVGQAARIKAMEYALNNPPIEKIQRVANLDEQRKAREKFAIEQQARAHKNSIQRILLFQNFKNQTPEAIGRNIDSLIGQHIADGRENNGEILVDNETYKSITGQDKVKSSVLIIDEGGNYKYGKKNDKGEFVVNGEIPLDAAKIKLTKTYKSGLDTRYNTGNKKPEIPKEKFPLPKGTSRTVKQNGVTYTWDSSTGKYQ